MLSIKQNIYEHQNKLIKSWERVLITCANSEDTPQSTHPNSLTVAFYVCRCKSQYTMIPSIDSQGPEQTVWMSRPIAHLLSVYVINNYPFHMTHIVFQQVGKVKRNPFMQSGLFFLNSLEQSILSFIGMLVTSKNSVDPDQTPYSVASALGLHCLPMSHVWDARYKWVKSTCTDDSARWKSTHACINAYQCFIN